MEKVQQHGAAEGSGESTEQRLSFAAPAGRSCTTCKSSKGPFGPRDPRCRPCLARKSLAYSERVRNDPALKARANDLARKRYGKRAFSCLCCSATTKAPSGICRACSLAKRRKGTAASGGLKVCNTCSLSLSTREFGADRGISDGLQGACRACVRSARNDTCECGRTKQKIALRCGQCRANPKLVKRARCVQCAGIKSSAYSERCRGCVRTNAATRKDLPRACRGCNVIKAPDSFGAARYTTTCLECLAAAVRISRPVCNCGAPMSHNAKTCMPCRDNRVRRGGLADNGLKECKGCRAILPLERFGPLLKAKDGLNADCKACISDKSKRHYRTAKGFERHLKSHYGCTVAYWQGLYDAQGGRCGGCSKALKRRALDGVNRWAGDGEDPHLDHCHDTGAIRGLLCKWCNLAAQKAMTPAALRGLADYLERTSAPLT